MYGVIGLIAGVGLPFVLEVSYEFNQQHQGMSHSEMIHSARVRSSSYFPPWGLVAASVVVFVGTCMRLAWNPSLRHRICTETMSYLSGALPCISRPNSNAQRERESWSPTRLVSLTVFVLAFTALPMLAWIDRAVWSAVSVDMFYTCKRECGVARALGHWQELDVACKDAQIDTALESRARWDRTGILPNITQMIGGFSELTTDDVKQHCLRILQVNSTQYIGALLKKGNVVSAFDSRLKTAYQIGIIEVYGAAFAISYFIMMFGSQLALSFKLRSLNNAKRELMSTHFLRTREHSRTYAQLFQRMLDIHGGLNNESYWPLAVLQKGSEDPPFPQERSTESWKEHVFGGSREDEEDRRLDAAEVGCTRHACAGLLGVLFAVGHTCIPGLFRVSSAFGGSPQPFFGSEEVKPALIMNAVVMFVFTALWSAKLVKSFYGKEEQLQLMIAFDCMWRFPGQNPMLSTLREDKSLLEEGEFSESTGDFSSMGYRAEFACAKNSQPEWKELGKLEEWYYMRHYIQVDQINERIAMELSIIVALLSLVPNILVMSYNFLFWSSEMSKLQPINFVTLYDCAFILAFVFRALMLTLAFNDHYDRHRESMLELIDHIKLEKGIQKVNKFRISTDSREATTMPMDDELDDAVKLVRNIQSAMARFDAPASFFGMEVNRKLITYFSSTAFVVLAPQVISIIQDMCKDI